MTHTRDAIAIPARPSAVPSERPRTSSQSRPCVAYSEESPKLGRRKSSITKSTWGICSAPAPIEPTASSAIAARIGSARSAIAWCGPGKPTSVSSGSPVAGLRGTSAWWGCPRSSSRASATGAPWKARKTMRNVYTAVSNAPR